MSKFAWVFAVLAIPSVAQANLISNGSFETGAVNPGSGFIQLSNGSTAITGWTVGGNSVDYIGTYWQAANGSRSVDLSGLNAGSMSQTFATIAGQQYAVTFDLAGNTDGGNPIKSLTVTAGADSGNFTFNTSGHSPGSMGWTPEAFTFTATGASTTLTFTSNENNPFGPALDNVSVDPVPEPATLAIFALMVGCGGLYLRRRVKAVAAA